MSLPSDINLTSEKKTPPKNNSQLPWALTVIFGVLSITLLAMYVVQGNELKDAKADPAATTTVTVTQKSAQEERQAELLRSLPRRDANEAAAMGSIDAPVVLIEWSDFLCHYCASFATTTHPELLPYVESGSLRIERRGMVMFNGSELATRGAQAAGLQGKYWEYYDIIFRDSAAGTLQVTEEAIVDYAQEAGVADLDKFKVDLYSDEVTTLISTDVAEAQQLGIGSVPFFVVNESMIEGAQPVEVFISEIEKNGGHK